MIAASSFSDSDFKTEDIKAKCIKAFPKHLSLSFLSFWFFIVVTKKKKKNLKTKNKIKSVQSFQQRGWNLFHMKEGENKSVLKGSGMEASLERFGPPGLSQQTEFKPTAFPPRIKWFPTPQASLKYTGEKINHTVRCIWEWKQQNNSNKYSERTEAMEGTPRPRMHRFCAFTANTASGTTEREERRKNTVFWVAWCTSLSSRNILAILLFHWESWLGFGMTTTPLCRVSPTCK